MLNPHARFASFVVGSSNRLAATAAKAVAEAPGSAYNPLFLYARPGLGKTHLLSAIGHETQAIDPSRRVEYVTVDDFVEAYHAALGAGQAEAYRRRFTESHVVLLDDAQLLTDQRELQSELLRLIDLLMAGDRQIVLAGDRPPEDIQSLDERLIRRFAGGLVIDIGAPDYETRLAILSRKATERQADFAPEVLAAAAEFPIGTVRELLGALNRLIAQQAVQQEPISSAQARTLLASLGHENGNGAVAPAPIIEAAPPSAAADEFADLLSELSATVSVQVDRWRRQVTEAALRYSGDGFRTARLDALRTAEVLGDPSEALATFDRDVTRLRELQAELGVLAPSLLGDAAMHDPDRVEDAERLLLAAREMGEPLPGPLGRYTLDLFFPGAATRPVVEAIRAAAESPGQRYNPLVLVGQPGVGKTHLLHAFGHALQAAGLARVAVLDAKQFVDDLVTATADGSIGRWRQRFRSVDALLLDDVGVLGAKERSQEELYLLYNLLLETGRQMAFTADVQPGHLQGFEPRLATRLAGGVVLELGPPEREARVAEIARLLGADADPDLVEFLASRHAVSIREVQQLVDRVREASEHRQAPLSLALGRELLDGATDEDGHRHRKSHGVLAPGRGAVRSREKMVEIWPDVVERMIEAWD